MVNVLYIGKDDGYWHNLQKRLSSDYETYEFKYIDCFHDDLDTFQKILLDIIKLNPHMIFIDYSAESLKVLTLARTLRRIYPGLHAMIGLWDYLAPKELIDESNTTGIIVTHIKSGEIGEVVRHAMLLYGGVQSDSFVQADLAQDLTLTIIHKMKIGYATKDYIHVEHNVLPPKNEKFQLKTNLLDGHFSEKFIMAKEINENFYYNFNYCSDFKILFNPETPAPPGESDQEKSWRVKDDEEVTQSRINRLEKWISENKALGKPKRTKLLVIDKELSIIEQADRPLDQYPFSIRFLREIDEQGNQLKQIKAGIICYQCPVKQEGQIRDLMAQIESFTGYEPFIVIFQSSWTSEYLKTHFKYERIMGQKDPFDLDVLLDFCRAYEAKEVRTKSESDEASPEDNEERVYINKNAPEADACYGVDIKLAHFTESWFKFQCVEELPLWSIYFVDWPLDVCLSIVEVLNEADWKLKDHHQYLGLIHCIGEKEKAEFRRQINDTIYQNMLEEEDEEET